MRRQSTEANREKNQMLELSNKDFKAMIDQPTCPKLFCTFTIKMTSYNKRKGQ